MFLFSFRSGTSRDSTQSLTGMATTSPHTHAKTDPATIEQISPLSRSLKSNPAVQFATHFMVRILNVAVVLRYHILVWQIYSNHSG